MAYNSEIATGVTERCAIAAQTCAGRAKVAAIQFDLNERVASFVVAQQIDFRHF